MRRVTHSKLLTLNRSRASLLPTLVLRPTDDRVEEGRAATVFRFYWLRDVMY